MLTHGSLLGGPLLEEAFVLVANHSMVPDVTVALRTP
jgi:hypothetical protein